jgi:hypothetical protein
MRLSSTARESSKSALGIRGIFLDAHQLVQELVDAKCETPELSVVQFEALVGLAVEDGEKALLEHVDGSRDVRPEQPAAHDDQDDPDRHGAENGEQRQPGRIGDEGRRGCHDQERAPSVFERRKRSGCHEHVTVVEVVGLLVRERVPEHGLGAACNGVIERLGFEGRVADHLEPVALGDDEVERPPGRGFAHAR